MADKEENLIPQGNLMCINHKENVLGTLQILIYDQDSSFLSIFNFAAKI